MRRPPAARALLVAMLTAGMASAHAPPSARVAELEHRLHATPRDLAALLELSSLHRDAGRLGRARASIDRATRVAPDDPAVLLEDGLVSLARKEMARAARALDRCLEREPDLAAARAARAALRLARGEREAAREDLLEAVRAEPTPDRVLLLSRVEEELGRADRAARVLEAGLGRLGFPASLRLAWVDLERRRGNYGEAARLLGPLIESSGSRAALLVERAELYRLARRDDAALSDLEMALAETDGRLQTRPSAALHAERSRILAALLAALGRLPGARR